MAGIDLTPFGFTPTESLVYRVLLTAGPGTGYAVARAAALARANAYSALEGLVTKGAARAEGGRPKRYRPEAPAALVARIASDQGAALERLSGELEELSSPASPTMVEIDSVRGALQLIGHDVARAERWVLLLAPPEAYPLLSPALRRPVAAGLPVTLHSTASVALDFAAVQPIAQTLDWPGDPLLAVVDGRTAVVAARRAGNDVAGHWSSAPAFVAAARCAIERFAGAA